MQRLSRDNYDKAAFWLNATKQALAHDCGYSNKALGETQTIMLAVNRDSDVLARANWQAITRDLTAKFGDEDSQNDDQTWESISGWYIERFNHWACGWVDYVVCDVSSESFQWLAEIVLRLQDRYPVYDEDLYSEIGHNELYEYLSSEIDYMRRRGDLTTRAPKSTDLIIRRLQQTSAYCQPYPASPTPPALPRQPRRGRAVPVRRASLSILNTQHTISPRRVSSLLNRATIISAAKIFYRSLSLTLLTFVERIAILSLNETRGATTHASDKHNE